MLGRQVMTTRTDAFVLAVERMHLILRQPGDDKQAFLDRALPRLSALQVGQLFSFLLEQGEYTAPTDDKTQEQEDL
jgi:hypothetical protein